MNLLKYSTAVLGVLLWFCGAQTTLCAQTPGTAGTQVRRPSATPDDDEDLPPSRNELKNRKARIGKWSFGGKQTATAAAQQAAKTGRPSVGSAPLPSAATPRKETEVVSNLRGQTLFRSPSGRVEGSAQTTGGRTLYRDASGKVIGSSANYGDRTLYRDATGRITTRDRLFQRNGIHHAPEEE